MFRLLLRWMLVLVSVSCAALALTQLIDLPQGNPTRGKFLYSNDLCAACHSDNQSFAPVMDGISDRVLVEAANVGEKAEQYLAESILDPDEYVVMGYRASVMPTYHLCPINCQGLSVTVRDLQDLVAYLRTV